MTRLGDKIRVEPLDDERLARIEQRVMVSFHGLAQGAARPRPWLRTLRWAVPAIAAAGVCLAIYLNVRTTMAPRGAGHGSVATRVVTDETGASTYELGTASLVAGKSTSLEIRRDLASGGIDIELAKGHVACEVEPRPERAAFVVHAGDVRVTVVGTAFWVDRSAEGVVRVGVAHGRVRVDSHDGTRYLNAGETWSGQTTLLARNSAVLPGAESQAMREGSEPGTANPASGQHGSGGSTADGVTPGVAERNGQDIENALVREGASGIGLGMDLDSPGNEALGGRASRGPEVDSQRDTRDSQRIKRSQAKLSREPERRALAREKPGRAEPPQGNDALAAVMELESKDPRAAIERYREYALRRGPEAEFALYSMAYVQYIRLGQRKAALESLRHYQHRFPRGAHTESVLWLRVRILCEGDDAKACRAAAHTYLSQFPGGRHADLAGEIIDWDM